MDAGRRQGPMLGAIAACWLAAFTAVEAATGPGIQGLHLEGCDNKLIAVVDLDTMFMDKANSRPPCFPTTLMVTPSNGRVYLLNNLTKDYAPHLAGAHAAGWFMADAIKKSKNYTPDMNEADVVYVNDYCYWVWWLAHMNYGAMTAVRTKVDDTTPGDHLLAAYEKLLQTPRWLQNGGADFVFFDGHPGFYEGSAKHHIWPLRCGAMQRSVQILADLPQRRRCAGFRGMQDRLVIAPLMATLADPHNEKAYTYDIGVFWEEARKDFERQATFIPLEEREMTVYFQGRCDPHSKAHTGKRLRNHIVREVAAQRRSLQEVGKQGQAAERGLLQEASKQGQAAERGQLQEVSKQAQAAERGSLQEASKQGQAAQRRSLQEASKQGQAGQRRQLQEVSKQGQAAEPAPFNAQLSCLEDSFAEAAELMPAAAEYEHFSHSVFCLILPDENQATKAVAEAFLGGCIPVFVGPPWHSMPFAEVVPYKDTALFLKLQNTSAFLDKEAAEQEEGSVAASVGAHPQEARWWQPDIPAAKLDGFATVLPDATHILPHLRQLLVHKAAELRLRMEAVWSQRWRFVYSGFKRGSLPGAVHTAMREVCRRNVGRPRVDWAKRHISSAAASKVKTESLAT